jgi:hypothetical protein
MFVQIGPVGKSRNQQIHIIKPAKMGDGELLVLTGVHGFLTLLICF